MIGDLYKDEVIKMETKQHLMWRLWCFYDYSKPEKAYENRELRPYYDYFVTSGHYYVVYKPFKRNGTPNRKAMLVGTDMLNIRVRVLTFHELEEYAESEKMWRYILDNSNISEELFLIARNNPYVKIPFSLDIEKICRKIREKEGIPDTDRRLVSVVTPKYVDEARKKESELTSGFTNVSENIRKLNKEVYQKIQKKQGRY